MSFDYRAYLTDGRWTGSRLGLSRMAELLERLGRPQDDLRFVHVAGTNGKGSVCAYLSRILRCAGLKVGVFSSPWLVDFEEQIQINGTNISPDELREIAEVIRDAADAMDDHPTEFEMVFAAALCAFARAQCEMVILEVGLGGRLDATNVIDAPEVCVITPIGFDHTYILGDTIEAIAREKAGIIKQGTCVITCPQEKDAARVIADRAKEVEVPLFVSDESRLMVGAVDENLAVRTFAYRSQTYQTQMLASYQPRNAALAIEAAQAMRGRGFRVSEAAIEEGVSQAQLVGRFQIVGRNPLTIIDGSHNPMGVRALMETLEDVCGKKRCVFIMGVLADKDVETMVDTAMPHAEAFVTATPPNPRALSGEMLAELLREKVAELGYDGQGEPPLVQVAESAAEALYMARDLACEIATERTGGAKLEKTDGAKTDGMVNETSQKPHERGNEGVVCAFGSLYLVGDYLRALENEGLWQTKRG